ncbi:hypothetical protein EDD86DRAFT_105562 [Gorgonomyces haynaldii]|nr:hypothetical protein EDD86DRAFT_105562 [Gorgonomyces haynaldii]
MPKKGKKKDQKPNTQKPFVPMPRQWPGKQSNADLFSQFAQEMRQNLVPKEQFVRLYVQQYQWDFNKVYITLPKESTLFRLQMEIAKLLHGNAVAPQSIVVYKPIPEQKEDEEPPVPEPIPDCEQTLSQAFPDLIDTPLDPKLRSASGHIRLGENAALYAFTLDFKKQKPDNSIILESLPPLPSPDEPLFHIFYDVVEDLSLSKHLHCSINKREPGPFGFTRLGGAIPKPLNPKKEKIAPKKPKVNKLAARAKAIMMTKLLKPQVHADQNKNISPELLQTMHNVKDALLSASKEALGIK